MPCLKYYLPLGGRSETIMDLSFKWKIISQEVKTLLVHERNCYSMLKAHTNLVFALKEESSHKITRSQ